MAKQPTLPQVSTRAARLRLLLSLVPLVALEVTAISGAGGFAFPAGVLAWVGLTLLSSLVTFGVAVALGAQVVFLTLGAGPRLDRRVVGNRVRTIRALPIGFGWAFLVRGDKAGRDYRIVNALGLLLPFALAAAAAAVLPAAAAAAVGLMTFIAFVLTGTGRDPGSGRLLVDRVFRPATVHTDPGLIGPGQALMTQIVLAVHFGDLGEAQAQLDRLRAIPGAEWTCAELKAELLAARGEYDAALRVSHPQPDPSDSATLTSAHNASNSARSAKLLLLLVEQDPSLAPKATPLALRHLKAVARARTGAGADRTGRVLFALHAGDPQAAKRENRICAARARTPLGIAEALCNQAVIESRFGKPAKAAKTLDRAARFAPWYPRIATVRMIAGARAATVLATVPAAAPGADTSHVFAEPWSVPQDGR